MTTNKTTTTRQTKANALQALRRELERLPQYRYESTRRDEMSEIEEHNNALTFDVRYLGDWEVPADEDDDGDYDWKVPTAATVKMLDALVKRFSTTDAQIRWQNQGEKCWVSFVVKL